MLKKKLILIIFFILLGIISCKDNPSPAPLIQTQNDPDLDEQDLDSLMDFDSIKQKYEKIFKEKAKKGNYNEILAICEKKINHLGSHKQDFFKQQQLRYQSIKDQIQIVEPTSLQPNKYTKALDKLLIEETEELTDDEISALNDVKNILKTIIEKKGIFFDKYQEEKKKAYIKRLSKPYHTKADFINIFIEFKPQTLLSYSFSEKMPIQFSDWFSMMLDNNEKFNKNESFEEYRNPNSFKNDYKRIINYKKIKIEILKETFFNPDPVSMTIEEWLKIFIKILTEKYFFAHKALQLLASKIISLKAPDEQVYKRYLTLKKVMSLPKAIEKDELDEIIAFLKEIGIKDTADPKVFILKTASIGTTYKVEYTDQKGIRQKVVLKKVKKDISKERLQKEYNSILFAIKYKNMSKNKNKYPRARENELIEVVDYDIYKEDTDGTIYKCKIFSTLYFSFKDIFIQIIDDKKVYEAKLKDPRLDGSYIDNDKNIIQLVYNEDYSTKKKSLDQLFNNYLEEINLDVERKNIKIGSSLYDGKEQKVTSVQLHPLDAKVSSNDKYKEKFLLLEYIDGISLSALKQKFSLLVINFEKSLQMAVANMIKLFFESTIDENQQYIHNDLHGGNIMYDSKNEKIVLIDYGQIGKFIPWNKLPIKKACLLYFFLKYKRNIDYSFEERNSIYFSYLEYLISSIYPNDKFSSDFSLSMIKRFPEIDKHFGYLDKFYGSVRPFLQNDIVNKKIEELLTKYENNVFSFFKEDKDKYLNIIMDNPFPTLEKDLDIFESTSFFGIEINDYEKDCKIMNMGKDNNLFKIDIFGKSVFFTEKKDLDFIKKKLREKLDKWNMQNPEHVTKESFESYLPQKNNDDLKNLKREENYDKIKEGYPYFIKHFRKIKEYIKFIESYQAQNQ